MGAPGVRPVLTVGTWHLVGVGVVSSSQATRMHGVRVFPRETGWGPTLSNLYWPPLLPLLEPAGVLKRTWTGCVSVPAPEGPGLVWGRAWAPGRLGKA